MTAYRARIYHQNDYRTTDWSGGTTTELAIAPEGSIYADRDFLWRLSSATVDVEKSDFTSLPDYNRIIMTLEGGIRLAHNGGEWIELPEFTPHAFDGEDETVSEGKVIDFNLMTRKGGCAGDVVPLLLQDEEEISLDGRMPQKLSEYEVMIIYCFEGKLTVTLESGEKYELGAKDALKLTGSFEGVSWECAAQNRARAVAAGVRRR